MELFIWFIISFFFKSGFGGEAWISLRYKRGASENQNGAPLLTHSSGHTKEKWVSFLCSSYSETFDLGTNVTPPPYTVELLSVISVFSFGLASLMPELPPSAGTATILTYRARARTPPNVCRPSLPRGRPPASAFRPVRTGKKTPFSPAARMWNSPPVSELSAKAASWGE